MAEGGLQRASYPLLGGVLLSAIVLSLLIGAERLSPDQVWSALFSPDESAHTLIVREIRVPRTVLGCLVGAALAVAGALMQVMTRNPLAEPGLLGITAGAGLAIILGVWWNLALSQTQVGQMTLAAIGAAVASGLVYLIGRTQPIRLLLAGVALSAVLAGIGLGLRLRDPLVLDEARFWLVGSLAGREQLPTAAILAAIAVGIVGACALGRPLDLLMLGDDVAAAMGVRVTWVRVTALLAVAVLAAAATAAAGPIAFVGLMVPHLARRLANNSVTRWLILSALLGASLLLVADIGARLAVPGGEVPVAIVTAFIGGPMLIWVIRRYGVTL